MNHPVLTSIVLVVFVLGVSYILARMYKNMLYVEQLKRAEKVRRQKAELHLRQRAGIDTLDEKVSNEGLE